MKFIRNYIKSSLLINPFYIDKIRGLNVVSPNRHTDLHLTGFSGSANTYCKKLFKEVFSDLQIVSHVSHRLYPLAEKIYLKLQ